MKSQRSSGPARGASPPAAQRAPGRGGAASGAGRGNAFRQEQIAAAGAPAQAPVVPEELLYGAFGEAPAKQTAGPEVGPQGAPSGTGSERTAGQPIAADEVARLYGAVAASRRGTDLLAELDASGARPALSWSGQGSYMMGGAVWLDTELEPAHLVDVLVHELQHVANARAGRTGDISTQDRATFVENSIEDEASAQTALLVAGLQSGSTGADVSGFLYGHLFQVDPTLAGALRNKDPGVDWKRVEELAHAYARKQFEEEAITSTTGERYPVYYGGQWDRANGKGS